MVDPACRELEGEIKKLAPKATPITQAQLAQAILQLNSKLRDGSLAAYKIHSSRQLHSGQNLKLSDSKLHHQQLENRHAAQSPTPVSIPKVGDTVTSISTQPKHAERNIYLITAASEDSVAVQKILHLLVPAATKFMSKTYTIRPKHMRVLHRPPPTTSQLDPSPPWSAPVPAVKYTNVEWSAVNRGSGSNSDDDSDSDNDPVDFFSLLGGDHDTNNDSAGSSGEDSDNNDIPDSGQFKDPKVFMRKV